jgi:hypothetical protein
MKHKAAKKAVKEVSKKPLKIFRWDDIVPQKYSETGLVVVAATLKEAKQLAWERANEEWGYSGPLRWSSVEDVTDPKVQKTPGAVAFSYFE